MYNEHLPHQRAAYSIQEHTVCDGTHSKDRFTERREIHKVIIIIVIVDYVLTDTSFKTDTSVQRAPRVGPCISLLPLFNSL